MQCVRPFQGVAAGRAPVSPFCNSRRSVARRVRLAVRASEGLPNELRDEIDAVISKHKVVAFIKGTKQFPQCGFSNTVVQILRSCEVPFETVNVLENDNLRSGMKVYSQWPTFPQVYINQEFVGGCDILINMYQDGSLKETLEAAMLE